MDQSLDSEGTRSAIFRFPSVKAAAFLRWIVTTESSCGRSPFPYDTPRFLISRIDPDGKTWINEDLIVDIPGERHVDLLVQHEELLADVVSPRQEFSLHSLRRQLSRHDVRESLRVVRRLRRPMKSVRTTCQGPPLPPADRRAPVPAAGRRWSQAALVQRRWWARWPWRRRRSQAAERCAVRAPVAAAQRAGARRWTRRRRLVTPERRTAIRREGSDPQKFAGVAKVNMATGELTRLFEGCAPGNGATLVTAGDLVFWGDLARNFRAIDADNGKVLWQTVLPGQHSEQHDHLCRQRQAIHCCADRTRRRDRPG